MKNEYVNNAGAAAGAAKGGLSPDIIGSVIGALGQVGVSAADAKKRRQMEYAMGQQRLQAELGLAEKSAKQAADTARLTLLAQAASGKTTKEEKKPSIALQVGIPLAFFAIIGTVVYFATKN